MDAGWKQIALEECRLHPLKCVGEGTSAFVVVARLGKSTSPMIPARQTRGQTSPTSSQLCALKVFKSKSNVVLQVAKREAHILARLHGHPNIIRISGAFKTARGRPILVMEFCSRSLQGVLDQHPRGLAAPAVKLLTWQLLQVLRYMHKRNYMHRDLKPSNLLLTDEGVVKLCDFGLARQVPRARSSKDMKKASSGSKQGDCGSTAEQYDNDQQPGFDTARTAPEEYTAARNGQLTPYVVTRWYRAPEILLGQPYGTASDIWSLGCTIAELASGSPLLPGSSTVDQIFHIWRMFRSLPSKNKPPGYACPVAPNRQPPTVTERREDQQFPLAFQPLQQAQQQSQSQAQPPQQEQWQPQRSIRHYRQLGTQLEGPLLDVLDAMLQTDPRVRPTAEELLNMPYFFNISEVITGTVMEHLYEKLNSASRSGSANNIDTGATIKKARGNEETASETAATTATAEGSLPYGQPYKAVVCNTASSAVLAAAADQQWADKGRKVKGPKRMKMREVVKIGAMLAASSQLLSGVQQTDVQLSGVVPACDDLGDRLVDSAGLPGDGSRCRPATNPAPLFEQDREVEEDYDVTLPPPPPPPPRTAVAMSCGLGPEKALGGARDPAGCRVGDAAAAAVRSDAPPGVQPATVDELMNPPHVSGSEGPDSGSDCCDARGDLITQFTCGPSYQISNGAAACEAQHQEQQQRRQNFVQRILDFIHQYGSPELGPLHAGDGYQGCDLHAAERAKLQQQSVQASKDTFYVAPAALPQAPCSDPTSLPSILPAALQQVMADEPGREQVPAAANVAEVAKLPTAADKTKTAGRSLRSVTPVNVSLSVSLPGLATVTTAVARTASKGLRSLSSTQERNQSQTAVSEVKVNWLSVPGTSMLSSTVDSEMKSPVADVGCLTGCWGRRGSAGKAAN